MKFAYIIEPPFNFIDANRAVTGCDVELARHVVSRMAESFEAVETSFAELLPGLSRGRWQVTTGLFISEERRKAAAFSRPIWALRDGLLVARGNPYGIEGYGSIARDPRFVLAVIRDQMQHRTALALGIPPERILVVEAYAEAAKMVESGRVTAYASVERAHLGYIERNQAASVEAVAVPVSEKRPEFGAFAFAKDDDALLQSFDRVLSDYLGSSEHRAMMTIYGFSDDEVDLVLS